MQWVERASIAVFLATEFAHPLTPLAAVSNDAKHQHAPLTTILVKGQIIGKKIKNPEGETLGEIQEVVLDRAGLARFVVLSLGGFIDIGGKHIAIPFDALKPTMKDDYLLDMSKNRLTQAPTLERNEWSKLDDEAWNRRVFRYFHLKYREPLLPPFIKLDIDQDGYLSRDEVRAFHTLSARFMNVDSNHDQRINQVEFSAFEASAEQVTPNTSPNRRYR